MSPGIIFDQYRLLGVAKPTRVERYISTCMPVTQEGIVGPLLHKLPADVSGSYLNNIGSRAAKPPRAELHIGTGMLVTQEQARAGSDLSRSYMSGLGRTIQLLAIGPGSHHRDLDFGLLPRQAAIIPSTG
ncbi:hypothetical protein BYT27DRAFT_7216778 [Phlegmacium glaucopus]|nr:hypothetical protein BYT27DRAFT_7216778 [Phlegmacium glaucopus]